MLTEQEDQDCELRMNQDSTPPQLPSREVKEEVITREVATQPLEAVALDPQIQEKDAVIDSSISPSSESRDTQRESESLVVDQVSAAPPECWKQTMQKLKAKQLNEKLQREQRLDQGRLNL